MNRWLLLIALVVVGCSSDGRALAEPTSDQTTTTRPPPPTSAPVSEESETGLVLTSPDFVPGDAPPVDATCAGLNTWPEFEWDNVPETATELAITLTNQTDPAEPLLLWLMAGISPNETGLQSSATPAGAFETLNDYGNLGYGSPCIESVGENEVGPIDLQFRIHVLEQPSGLAGGDAGNEAWDMLSAAAVDSASVLVRLDTAETTDG